MVRISSATITVPIAPTDRHTSYCIQQQLDLQTEWTE